jgi:hypothetical protein
MEEVPQACSIHEGYSNIDRISLEHNVQRLQSVSLQVSKVTHFIVICIRTNIVLI